MSQSERQFYTDAVVPHKAEFVAATATHNVPVPLSQFVEILPYLPKPIVDKMEVDSYE